MGETDKTESFYRDTTEERDSDDHSLEDPLSFWREEKKALWKKIFGRSETPFFIMGAGLVLLVVIFFAVAPRGENQDVIRQVDLLSERLKQAEEKLSSMEALQKGVAQLENRMETVDKSILRVDNTAASGSLRMNQMADELSLIQKDINALKSQKTAARAVPAAAGTAQSVPQAVFHEVQPGETLYGISRRYNMSVDSLRRLNGLSEQTAIHPGQKLKVKDSGN